MKTRNTYLKVKDRPDLVREKKSNAILNTDHVELNKYREDRNHKIRMKRLVEENEQMRADIDEIKSLLKQLLGQK
jgi:hypothetical protein